MKKIGALINRIILWYLAVGLPLVIFNWACVHTARPLFRLPKWLAAPLNELAFLWFLGLLYFLVRFSCSRCFRYRFTSKLAGISERDEREVQIVGGAAKRSLVFGIAVLVIGLFFSLIQVELTHNPPDKGSLAIGIGASFDLEQFYRVDTVDGNVTRLVLDFLPRSLAPFLMFFLFAQLAVFRVHARSIHRGPAEES